MLYQKPIDRNIEVQYHKYHGYHIYATIHVFIRKYVNTHNKTLEKSILLGSWQRRGTPEVEESDAANLNWIRLDKIQFFVARPRLLD